MPRSVFCKKYQQELEGLDAPPYPGPKGQDIFDNVSKKAWQDWQAHQTMLVIELLLSLLDRGARESLQEVLAKCLAGADSDEAEGSVAPSD